MTIVLHVKNKFLQLQKLQYSDLFLHNLVAPRDAYTRLWVFKPLQNSRS